MIKVITADDHALIRKGLRHMLAKTSDVRVSAEVENGHQLLKRLRAEGFDVIILDLTMPGMDVFELIQKVKEVTSDTPILMLSMHPEERFGLQLLKAGVAGYLNKSSGLNDIAKAVRQVHSGKRFISENLAIKLADRLVENKARSPHEGLSEREFQVLCFIATGKTVSDIADELNLSVKTISTYRTRLLEKMDLENNAQLTYYAIQNRLV